MKNFLIAATIAATSLTAPAFAADVGVSVSIGQPGFYGQIDIGNFAQPRVLYAQPMIVDRGIPMNRAPIYLRVPPGHAKHWSKHCHEYNACNQRVYFVNNEWYERDYAPRYQQEHGYQRDDRRNESRGDDRRNRHNEDRGDRDDNRGNQGNNGHGRDH
ncbi:MAG: hypothetical protein PHO27_01730 [Sulfuricurvum sp.]|nr:hypothetical protein [Sulfuricurvum sp.]